MIFLFFFIISLKNKKLYGDNIKLFITNVLNKIVNFNLNNKISKYVSYYNLYIK